MSGVVRGGALVLAVLAGGCGIFDEDEEPIEGERIPVREYRSLRTVQPAPEVTPLPESEPLPE